MSLESLKNDWDSLKESSTENKISNKQIETILRLKYRSFVARILIFEVVVLLTMFYFLALTIFRFDELEIFYLEVLGSISIAILALLIIIRFIKLYGAYRNRFLNQSHVVAVKKLAKRTIEIQKFYLLNIILGFLLVVILFVLNIKIYNEYDLIQSKSFWSIITPGSLIFIVLINRWIRKYYKKVVRETEDLLQELN